MCFGQLRKIMGFEIYRFSFCLQEVVDFVRNRIGGAMCLEDICEDLMSRCLAPDIEMGGLGCDNMTVIIIAFLHGKTYDALCAKCASPNSIGYIAN